MSLHSTEYGPHQPQTTLAAMEYDYRRHQSGVSFVFPNYYAHERNAPLALSQVSRVDPRTCPIGGPNGGMRTRGGAMREEEIQENSGNSRRRIAVAVSWIQPLLSRFAVYNPYAFSSGAERKLSSALFELQSILLTSSVRTMQEKKDTLQW
jgi:hypothetical protein